MLFLPLIGEIGFRLLLKKARKLGDQYAFLMLVARQDVDPDGVCGFAPIDWAAASRGRPCPRRKKAPGCDRYLVVAGALEDDTAVQHNRNANRTRAKILW